MKTLSGFLLFTLCCGLLPGTAPAQERPEAGDVRPARPPVASRPPSPTQERPEPAYINLPIADVLTTYGKITGTKVIFDLTVQGELVLPKFQDLSDEKKAELIERTLFMDGFTMFDAGDHVVAVLGLGKQPRTEGLPVYTKPEELPSGERVFSYVIKLARRNAESVAAVLQRYVPPTNMGAFTPDESSHSLIVTGPTSVVRSVLKLMPLLDVSVEVVKTPEMPPPNTSRPTPVPKAEGSSGL